MQDYSFFAVMESSSPIGEKHEILEMKEEPNGTISRLRFRACMQDFGHRNRNGRLWTGKYMKDLLNAPHIKELLVKGFPGENGHPVPPTGEASMQRIMTIDPNNISHKILNFQWVGESKVYSDVETVVDIDGPGTKFALNIAQGFEPAFSVRSVVPQRRNADGTIDVMPGGRVITYDRVFLPSHQAAYRDEAVDVKQVTSTAHYAQLMESLTSYALSHSEKVNAVLDGTDPVMESACVDNRGTFSINTRNAGRLFIPTERGIAREISSFMKNMK